MGGGGEREGMVDGGGGLRVGKKIENKKMCLDLEELLHLTWYGCPSVYTFEQICVTNLKE